MNAEKNSQLKINRWKEHENEVSNEWKQLENEVALFALVYVIMSVRRRYFHSRFL